MRKSAKVLTTADVDRLLAHVAYHRNDHRDRVMVLLSFKAGLRAAEIAGLEWSMVLKPDGRLGEYLEVVDRIAKMGSGRRIPLNATLKAALRTLHRHHDRPMHGPVIRSERGSHMTARSIVNWFASTYQVLGYRGCSSHSGRRTFITKSARLLAKTGGSLRDIQELAGHRAITTTEKYIEGDRDAQRKLISLL